MLIAYLHNNMQLAYCQGGFMNTNNIFGKRIKELRTNANLTQQQLGTYVGLSKQAINDIENGRRETKLIRAIKLAQVFNTNVEYLAGYEYQKTTPNPINYTPPQYSDAALDIARKYDDVTPDIQRRIERYVSGEYDDYCQSSAEKLIEKTGSYS